MRKHWFKILVVAVLLFFAGFFTILALSPKKDLQRRGFIPCTEALVEDLSNCRQQMRCGVKAILENSWCDMGVIAEGFRLWVKGVQTTPWSNYLFTPDLHGDDAELRQFYSDNPNIDSDMNELIELSAQQDDESSPKNINKNSENF